MNKQNTRLKERSVFFSFSNSNGGGNIILDIVGPITAKIIQEVKKAISEKFSITNPCIQSFNILEKKDAFENVKRSVFFSFSNSNGGGNIILDIVGPITAKIIQEVKKAISEKFSITNPCIQHFNILEE